MHSLKQRRIVSLWRIGIEIGRKPTFTIIWRRIEDRTRNQIGKERKTIEGIEGTHSIEREIEGQSRTRWPIIRNRSEIGRHYKIGKGNTDYYAIYKGRTQKFID